MNCPVCGAEGADDQPVGPSVTVFCCAACVSTILRSFASRAEQDDGPPAPRADTAPGSSPTWRPAPA